MKRILRYAIGGPANILCGIFFALVCLFVWTKPRAQNDCLACEIKNRWYTAWWLNRFNGGALGHFLFYRPGALDTIQVDTPLEYHENEGHVDQFEANALLGFIYGAVDLCSGGNPLVGLAVWTFTPAVSYICGGIIAVLRGGNFYQDNYLEQGARGETAVWMSNDRNNN
jgi:hypothetical protein